MTQSSFGGHFQQFCLIFEQCLKLCSDLPRQSAFKPSELHLQYADSDGVKRVWQQPGVEYKDKCVLPTVEHGGGSVMVWGCMSAAGSGDLQFIEGTMNDNMYCDILKKSMIPSLQRLGRRAVFQHDNDHCLAKEAEGKCDALTKNVSRPKPYWASVRHP